MNISEILRNNKYLLSVRMFPTVYHRNLVIYHLGLLAATCTGVTTASEGTRRPSILVGLRSNVRHTHIHIPLFTYVIPYIRTTCPDILFSQCNTAVELTPLNIKAMEF